MKKVKKSKRTNKSLLIILLTLLAVLGGSLLAEKQVKINKIPTQTSQGRLNKIEISGVTMNDFYKFDQPKHDEYATISKTQAYHIFYIPDQNLFYISITYPPFEQNRIAAEEDFLDKLGITKEDACELDVDLTTPGFVGNSEAGKVYHLSFCSN